MIGHNRLQMGTRPPEPAGMNPEPSQADVPGFMGGGREAIQGQSAMVAATQEGQIPSGGPDSGQSHQVSEANHPEWMQQNLLRAQRPTVGAVTPQLNRPGYGGGPNAPQPAGRPRMPAPLHDHDTLHQIVNFNGGAHVSVQYLQPKPGGQYPQTQSATTAPNRPSPPFGRVVIGPFPSGAQEFPTG